MGSYESQQVDKENGMDFLRTFFDKNKPNQLGFVLFSTSGVHGSYSTIEDAEAWLRENKTKEHIDYFGNWGVGNSVTFLIIQPRIVGTIYGNCLPETQGDIDFLKQLRQDSWDVVKTIGASDIPF